jgi:hypothetical protein
MTSFKRYRYKNLALLLFSVILAFLLSGFEPFHSFILNLGELGFVGAFLAGILFVSTFTVATSILVLITLTEVLSPLEISFVAGLGAVVGDLTIFKFIRNDLLGEIRDIYARIDTKGHLTKVLHTKYFAWTLPVIGAALIASPFPDELGISLIGISKLKTYQFISLSFILNAVGIFLIASAVAVIRH